MIVTVGVGEDEESEFESVELALDGKMMESDDDDDKYVTELPLTEILLDETDWELPLAEEDG